MIRQAAYSGSWYPNNPLVVNTVLEDWFSEHSKINDCRAKSVIVPHAGWRFSGSIASSAFKQFENRNVSRVFIFGPCHRYYASECLLSGATVFETPIGNLSVDTECITELRKSKLFGNCSMEDEENEHSLEIEMPFIVKCFGTSVKIVPIMVGKVNAQQKKRYAQILKPYFEDEETVFVISSDFCHWGSAFSFQYYNPKDGEIWESIEKLDRLGAQFICDHDADGFAEYIDTTHNTICGRNCIEILLRIIQSSHLSLKTCITEYGQSSHAYEMSDRSVSYCAMVTYEWSCLFTKTIEDGL